jgi:hypothetical protein
MTVKALEGELRIPDAPLPEGLKLGFGRALPTGEAAISEAFRPNPDDDPNSSALFNVFIESHDFTGDVYLLKATPSDTKEFQDCMFRVLSRGEEKKWAIAPDEHICDTVQEPENGVAYHLAIFGSTPGQLIYFRMSL